jgi:hypothetical protein
MPTVADALRQHAPAYLRTFADRVPLGHRKVLSYIMRCGTGQLGNVIYKCKSCQQQHWVGRSCGNRHCPGCQKQKTSAWLARQSDRLLPVQHFVVTFTVPQELRSLLRGNQQQGYSAIFNAGSRVIRTLLANDRNLGSDKLGFFGVLHTWGRDPRTYHPHVHFVVPGGGVSRDGRRWLQVNPDQLLHPLPAKMLYKQLFVEELRRAGLYDQLPYGVLKLDWVVNIKPVGNGQAVLKYLAPYIYRVAISDSRIVNVDQHGVTYRVQPSGRRDWVVRHASGEQFVRGFCQHILPSGFQKVRYYGFMSPNCKLQLENVRWLVWLWRGWTYWLGSAAAAAADPPVRPSCSRCGGELELLAITAQCGKLLWIRQPASRGPPCAAWNHIRWIIYNSRSF